MKPATKVVRRALVDGLGRVALLDHAAVRHDRDPVGHRQRLLLVVGDVDEGDPDVALDPLQLQLQALAQLQVEGAERLVEQQHLRQVDERAGERDALLLPAGELVGLAVDLRARGPTRSSSASTRCLISAFGDLLAAQPEGDVLAARSGAGTARSSGRRCWWGACGRGARRRRCRRSAPGPAVGCSKPATIRSVVVLPQPLRAEHGEELAPRRCRDPSPAPRRGRRSAC